MKKLSTLFLMTLLAASLHAQRSEYLLEKNWKFMKGEAPEAMKPEFDDRKWETVTVPHDWAIFGPFDRSNDLQEVAVTQNFEKKASVKTGRTVDFLMLASDGIVLGSMPPSINRRHLSLMVP